ncbi:MAG: alpha/beta hydrolase [bacterium]
MTDRVNILQRDNAPSLAWQQIKGSAPGLFWLGGYASDMMGTKASYLSTWAEDNGIEFTRFDYTGHGQSDGDFEQGTISLWRDDAAAILQHATDNKQILIGSSMGAWIACLLAKQFPDSISALILIAPAPDFTSELMWPSWDADKRETIQRDGRLVIPSAYDDSEFVYTLKMIEDGHRHRVLNQDLRISAPVRILQGMRDDIVPWQHAMRLAEHIDTDDLEVSMMGNSDHRMSSRADLQKLLTVLQELR